jgi:hypothetical protein
MGGDVEDGKRCRGWEGIGRTGENSEDTGGWIGGNFEDVEYGRRSEGWERMEDGRIHGVWAEM